LPEDRPDLEKLPGKRRNQNPVEQIEIKLDVIFHLPLERAECQGARLDESRKFSAPLSKNAVMLSKAKHLCSIFLRKRDPKN
jgi:hypothetical protein